MKKSSKFLQSSKDMLHRSFKPDKCKTSLRLVISRLKLLRNKKEAQVKQMRREISQLLESGQNQTARIRVEHVVREEKTMAAYELIGLYSELIISRMSIIESQKNCPIDLKEAITSVVFASPRCSDVPELDDIRKQFTAKYGKDFIGAAIELRPESGVSRLLVEKLSAKAPDGPTKLKVLTAIAEEHSIQWDPKSFGENEMMNQNDLLNGPTAFGDSKVHMEPPRYEASSTGTSQNQMNRQPSKPEPDTRFSQGSGNSYYDTRGHTTGNSYYDTRGHTESPPYEASDVRTSQSQMHEQPSKPEEKASFSHGTGNSYYTQPDNGGPTISSTPQHEVRHSGGPIGSPVDEHSLSMEGSTSRKTWNMEFKDAASAARAAAESAEQASMAARAAAELAHRDRASNQHFTEAQRPGVHVQQDNTAEKHSSIKLAGEQFPKDTTSSINADRQPRSQNEQVQGGAYDSFRGVDEKFDHGGYGSTDTYSQQTSFVSKASVDDSSFTHGTREDDHYSQKNSWRESADEPESVTRKPFGSEYTGHHEGSRPENDHIQENDTLKHRVSSSRLHSNIYDDDNYSWDSYQQNFDTHGVPDDFSSSDQQHIYGDKSRPGVSGSPPAVSDKSNSDDDKVLYDTGPKFDEPDYDFEHLSLGRTSPSNFFTNPDAWDSELGNSRSPKKSVSSEQNSSSKHFSHVFSEVSTAPVSESKLDNSMSMKFDDSDGVDSESEDSVDESRHSVENYSAKVPGNENETHKSHQRVSSDEVEYAEVQKMDKQKTGLHSDSSKNFDSSQSHDRKSEAAHQDEDKYRFDSPPEEIADDEALTRSNSNVGSSRLNFGKLTGGLKHKGFHLPPYTRRQSDDVPYSSKTPAEKSSSRKWESPADEFPSYDRANVDRDDKTSLRVQNSAYDSDTDSSEDDNPVQISTRGKSYSQEEKKGTESKSRLHGTARYSQVQESPRKPFLESDSEEELPKPTFSRKKTLGSGLSRRTKPTPAGTSGVLPPREESRRPDSGADRRSGSSSYSARPLEEPDTQKHSSGQARNRNSDESSSRKGSSDVHPRQEESRRSDSGAYGRSGSSSYSAQPLEEPDSQTRVLGQPRNRNSDQSSSGKGSFQPMTYSKPLPEESKHSVSGADRRTGSSSYSAQPPAEPESQTRNSGQPRNRNSDQPSSNKGSVEPKPSSSKMPVQQESLKSSVARQSPTFQEKVEASDSVKSSESLLKSVDCSKKPSHVHPKLPDYDNLLESFGKNRG